MESHSRQLEEDLNALERARMEENMPPLTGEIQRNFGRKSINLYGVNSC